eukprot:631985-Rhodomonas_salina.2
MSGTDLARRVVRTWTGTDRLPPTPSAVRTYGRPTRCPVLTSTLNQGVAGDASGRVDEKGTKMAAEARCVWRKGPECAYGRAVSPGLWIMGLCLQGWGCAVRCTERVYGAIGLQAVCYAMSGTELVYGATVLSAICGTERAYGASLRY